VKWHALTMQEWCARPRPYGAGAAAAAGAPLVCIAFGRSHKLALTNDGAAWCGIGIPLVIHHLLL